MLDVKKRSNVVEQSMIERGTTEWKIGVHGRNMGSQLVSRVEPNFNYLFTTIALFEYVSISPRIPSPLSVISEHSRNCAVRVRVVLFLNVAEMGVEVQLPLFG